jgi:hypothetical protein
MPSRKTHLFIDREILGREYPLVHMYKDSEWVKLGRRHRVKHHYNTWENAYISCLLYGCSIKAFLSAQLHDVFDADRELSWIAEQYRKIKSLKAR